MKSDTQQNGIANIWVVLTIPVLVGFVGLAIDLGYMAWVGQQLQIGADAAALAGARLVKKDVTEARTAAINVALANTAAAEGIQLSPNDGNAADGDIVVGRFDRDTATFDSAAGSPNAVKVVARRTDSSLGGPLPLLFGPVLGFTTTNMQRTAIAMIGGGTGSGIIALDPDAECALDVYGSLTLLVDGGDVQVNSDLPCAACFQGAGTVDSEAINVVGEVCVTGGAFDLPDEINTAPDVEPIPDPLASLPAPTWDPADDLGTVSLGNGPLSITPGFYSGGISATGGTLTLEPGIYILDGAGLDIGGNANLVADGVMFYITGAGSVNLHGTGNLLITPPDPDNPLHTFPGVDTYEYVSIFQDRNNSNEGTIIGTTLMDLQGSYYFPQNHIQLGGDAQKFGNQLIAWTIEIFGNGELIINYEGQDESAGSRVFLVF